jgi:hypothetical protein
LQRGIIRVQAQGTVSITHARTGAGRGILTSSPQQTGFDRNRCIAATANSQWHATIRSPDGSSNETRLREAGLRVETSMWVLLLVPFIGLLWVPFYNFVEPSLFGFPFFYWYQLAWVPITSLLIWLVYRSRTPDEAP